MSDSLATSPAQASTSLKDRGYLLATLVVLFGSVAVLCFSWYYLADLYSGPPYAIFVAILAVEMIRSKVRGKQYFSFNATMDNISLAAFQRTLTFVHPLYSWGLYLLIFEQFRLFDIDPRSLWAIFGALVCYDFAFYWGHRLAHRINILWAAHVVHHQSEEFNLSVAFRASSFQFSFYFIFYLSLAVIGFTPGQFIVAQLIHGIWQYLIHIRVSKSMGPIEYIFITPSLHGIHHAMNDKYLDKNYGAMFSIWDQMFGTFVKQDPNVEPRFGIVRQMNSWNPIAAVFMPWVELFRLSKQVNTLPDLFRVWFGTPEFNYALQGDKPGAPRDIKPVNWQTNVYVVAQMAPAGLATYALFRFGYTLPVMDRIALFAIVAISLFCAGLLLDHSAWARRFETFRLGMLAVCGILASAYFSATLVAQSQWPMTPYVTGLFSLVFCGISLYYFRTSAHFGYTAARQM